VLLFHAVFASVLPWVRGENQRVDGASNFAVRPGSDFWFGSDQLGKDVFARCVYGARLALTLCTVSILVGLIIGGAVGMTAAAKAAPDGYTVLMTLSSISIFPVSDPINGKAAPYEIKDFAPIALLTADPTVLVVRADSPYKTIQDFIAAAKANPNKINYSSSGVYGTLHVAMEIFANAAGIKLFHVPYQGGGPAVTALLGGQVEASAQGPAAAIGQTIPPDRPA